MNTQDVIRLARDHVYQGSMETSSRVCLADAVKLYDAGDFAHAKARALESLAYSVGVMHPDYRKAAHAA